MGCCNSRVPPPVQSKPAPVPVQSVPEENKSPLPNKPKSFKQRPSRTPSSATPLIAEPKKKAVSKNFECQNGHELLWHADIPFKYESINYTWMIRCDACSNVYTGSGYHCHQCNYNLCDNCCLPFDKPRQVMYCEVKHELIWSPAQIWNYKSQGYSASFNCNICKANRYEPSWSCEICSYDACLKCAQLSNIIPPQDFIMCKTVNHTLDYALKIEPNDDEKPVAHLCDLCENTISDSEPRLYCNSHSFDVCIECVNSKLDDMLPHPGFKCKEEKNLKVQSREKVKEETGDDIKCQVCENAEFELGYICGDCVTCYCLNCSGKIHRGILNCHKQTCTDGHRLSWVPCSKKETKVFNCNICKQRFSCGAFSCSDCNYYVCVNDFKLE